MKRLAVPLLLIWFIAGALFWAIAPRPPEPEKASAQLADWTPPELDLSDPERAWTDLRVRQIWGAPPPPPGVDQKPEEPQPLTRPDWRILAAIAAGGEQYVVVRIGEEPPVNVKTGEHLPDGSLLARVEPDRLYLVFRGRKRVLRIYPE
jgi:hypothetical protein